VTITALGARAEAAFLRRDQYGVPGLGPGLVTRAAGAPDAPATAFTTRQACRAAYLALARRANLWHTRAAPSKRPEAEGPSWPGALSRLRGFASYRQGRLTNLLNPKVGPLYPRSCRNSSRSTTPCS